MFSPTLKTNLSNSEVNKATETSWSQTLFAAAVEVIP
jgi:hypothetical protein